MHKSLQFLERSRGFFCSPHYIIFHVLCGEWLTVYMQLYCIYVVDQYYFVSFFYSILYTTSIEANDILGYAPSIFLFNGLLWVLQILHVLWFIIIIKAAYKAVIVGQVRLPISYSSLNEKIFMFDFDSSAWKSIGCSLFKLFSSILAVNDEKKGNWITNVEFSRAFILALLAGDLIHWLNWPRISSVNTCLGYHVSA